MPGGCDADAPAVQRHNDSLVNTIYPEQLVSGSPIGDPADAGNGVVTAESQLSVRRLTLTDFRCFAHLRLAAGPEPVVLTGPNGAGKTTVLEALSLLAPGRGLRRARLEDVARWQAHGGAAASWGVAVRLQAAGRSMDVGTGREPASGGATAERRQVRVDGRPLRNQAALADLLGVSWLTPDMDRLFMDGAATRRRFLDRLVFGIDPAHAVRVSAYERAMRQRARLLREGGKDPGWLGALEDSMARHGVATAAARREATDRLDNVGRSGLAPFPAASLDVTGTVERWLDEAPALAVEDRLRALLASSRGIDRETGGAADGPHKTDLSVRHAASGRAAAACSTGEQKALLIAIVLTAAQTQAAVRQVPPLVLLDEVAAHLDGRHRGALFELVSALGVQSWYTGTDATLFRPLVGRAQFLMAADGTVAGA